MKTQQTRTVIRNLRRLANSLMVPGAFELAPASEMALQEAIARLKHYDTMKAYIRGAARLVKDGECTECGPGVECTDGDHEPFDMPNDDAVDSLHSLINDARELKAVIR